MATTTFDEVREAYEEMHILDECGIGSDGRLDLIWNDPTTTIPWLEEDDGGTFTGFDYTYETDPNYVKSAECASEEEFGSDDEDYGYDSD
jgi:hypothetical protein